MPGVRIQVRGARFGLALVPLPHKPIPNADRCPTCQVPHTIKAVHLWLDGDGACIVSQGVLDDLKAAGLEKNGIDIMGEVVNPPALNFGPGVTRQQLDQQNARIWIPGVTNG